MQQAHGRCNVENGDRGKKVDIKATAHARCEVGAHARFEVGVMQKVWTALRTEPTRLVYQ